MINKTLAVYRSGKLPELPPRAQARMLDSLWDSQHQWVSTAEPSETFAMMTQLVSGKSHANSKCFLAVFSNIFESSKNFAVDATTLEAFTVYADGCLDILDPTDENTLAREVLDASIRGFLDRCDDATIACDWLETWYRYVGGYKGEEFQRRTTGVLNYARENFHPIHYSRIRLRVQSIRCQNELARADASTSDKFKTELELLASAVHECYALCAPTAITPAEFDDVVLSTHPRGLVGDFLGYDDQAELRNLDVSICSIVLDHIHKLAIAPEMQRIMGWDCVGMELLERAPTSRELRNVVCGLIDCGQAFNTLSEETRANYGFSFRSFFDRAHERGEQLADDLGEIIWAVVWPEYKGYLDEYDDEGTLVRSGGVDIPIDSAASGESTPSDTRPGPN